MKTYNKPSTEIIPVINYLCQTAASPVDTGYHPLSTGGVGEGQGDAM